tara:strand:- start:105 stop:356 length:252 start_codon:yes stop_codon:yes gene_type:complete
MKIQIHALELPEEVRTLYLSKQLYNLGIDYATSNLLATRKGRQGTLIVYSFSKILRLDNRFASCKIFQNTAEIIIEFKVGEEH